MKCAECMWAIWDYVGMQCVDCMACKDEKCPTEEDIKYAKARGFLAYYGCCKMDTEKNKKGA